MSTNGRKIFRLQRLFCFWFRCSMKGINNSDNRNNFDMNIDFEFFPQRCILPCFSVQLSDVLNGWTWLHVFHIRLKIVKSDRSNDHEILNIFLWRSWMQECLNDIVDTSENCIKTVKLSQQIGIRCCVEANVRDNCWTRNCYHCRAGWEHWACALCILLLRSSGENIGLVPGQRSGQAETLLSCHKIVVNWISSRHGWLGLFCLTNNPTSDRSDLPSSLFITEDNERTLSHTLLLAEKLIHVLLPFVPFPSYKLFPMKTFNQAVNWNFPNRTGRYLWYYFPWRQQEFHQELWLSWEERSRLIPSKSTESWVHWLLSGGGREAKFYELQVEIRCELWWWWYFGTL